MPSSRGSKTLVIAGYHWGVLKYVVLNFTLSSWATRHRWLLPLTICNYDASLQFPFTLTSNYQLHPSRSGNLYCPFLPNIIWINLLCILSTQKQIVNTTFKLGPSSLLSATATACIYTASCIGMLHLFQRRSVWLLPVQQKAGQLLVTLHPQSLFQCSKVAESQTEIHSCSRMSFICLMFRLNRAIFPFLRRYICIHSFLQSERRPVSVFYPLSTSSVCCHWLEETHPLHTQKRPDKTKTSKSRQGAGLCRRSHHHTCTEAQKWRLSWIHFVYFVLRKKLLTQPLSWTAAATVWVMPPTH